MREGRQELSDYVPQCPRTSALVRCRRSRCDARSAMAFACEPAIPLQFRIGARDRVGCNTEIAGELPNRGQR